MFALLMLAFPTAHAWEHTGLTWREDQFPLAWRMYPVEEDSLEEGESLDILQQSWDNWSAAECASIGHEYEGNAGNAERSGADGAITIHWEDPSDEIEAGVLGVTYSIPGNAIVKEINGRIYQQVLDSDIVFNDNVDFKSDEAILAGATTATSIEAVATHEIGHLHGLDHSCEDGDPCTETDLEEATMFWSVGAGDLTKSDINADDIQSITTLYGSSGYFVANSDRIGGTPLAVEFEVVSDVAVVGASWNFGDGETSTEINPTHEYTRSGQFTVQAELQLEDPVCGISTYTYDELGFVLACEPPSPAEDATGFFTMAHKDGLTWSTVNHTDVSVYGCVDTIAWEVYEGDGEGAISPDNLVDLNGDEEGELLSLGAWSPNITFPAEGTYTVVMNVGGPGGLKASFLTVQVEDRAAEGGGCATGGSALGLTFGGLALAAAAGLRRRRA